MEQTTAVMTRQGWIFQAGFWLNDAAGFKQGIGFSKRTRTGGVRTENGKCFSTVAIWHLELTQDK